MKAIDPQESRVREIYKRGPLYSTKAMLSAHDRLANSSRATSTWASSRSAIKGVHCVGALGDQIAGQRASLVRLHDDVESSRQEKADEEKRLRALEEQRGRSLAQAQASQKQAEARLAQIAKDETRLSSVIATLEVERKRAEGRSGNAIAPNSTLRTADLGRYDWGVEGGINPQFGRLVNPNNTSIRWNGVGIAAAIGSPVKAVAAGTVALIDQNFGTYGPTVFIQHGGGDYSVYASLGKIAVEKGTKVAKGQIIGSVGKTDPDLGPHLHFEIRGYADFVVPSSGCARESNRSRSARRAHLRCWGRRQGAAARGRCRRHGDADLHQAAQSLVGARMHRRRGRGVSRGAQGERGDVHKLARQLSH